MAFGWEACVWDSEVPSSDSVITIIPLDLKKIRWISCVHLCKRVTDFLSALRMILGEGFKFSK